MTRHLFAYGTLKPGLTPAEAAPLVARLTLVGEGTVPGRLYLLGSCLGSYPGAVLDPGSETRIHGVVYELPEDDATLRNIDAYEEYYAADPVASQFVRVQRPVAIKGNGEILCWIYVYNRPVGGALLIENGVFCGSSL
jgi:gamma-glutamylcyclotransferase (GGCT)/AIG2-like uncharacterized protein YtfP